MQLIQKAFTGLVPIEQVKAALVEITDVEDMAQFDKKVEAARKYDSETGERRNYWGEFAIFSSRRLGELIKEGKESGEIRKGAGKPAKGDNSNTLLELGIEPMRASRCEKIAEVGEEDIREYVEACQADESAEVSKAGLVKYVAGAHVSSNSGQNEWYTPPEYIEAARAIMGGIDLDPASSKVANKTVGAAKFFTERDDGLSKQWAGRIWMNPPYARELVGKFMSKLLDSDYEQAVTLTNNSTDSAWLQAGLQAASVGCFPAGRVAFLTPSGDPSGKPLQGQCLLYFGRRKKQAMKHLSQFGFCWEQ